TSLVASTVITSVCCSFGLSIARFILDALKAPTNSSARGKGCLTFSTNSLSVIGYGPEQGHAPGCTATTNRRDKSRERVSQSAYYEWKEWNSPTVQRMLEFRRW